MQVRLFRPRIREEAIDAAVAVLRSGWIGLGSKTAEFEYAFARYAGAPYCVGLNSCTSALHLALRILDLPPETRLFMCHDYKAPGRDSYAWETNVAEERAKNVHVHEGVSEDDFVKMRQTRDATLAAPLLLLPSIQVNIRAGHFPPADANGVHYLKVPVKLAS